jgi:hypothetical protein
LGPAAIPVGAAVWGGSKAAQEIVSDPDAKKVFGFVSDVGKDTLVGGVFSGVSSITSEIGGSLSREVVHATGSKARTLSKTASRITKIGETINDGYEAYGNVYNVYEAN